MAPNTHISGSDLELFRKSKQLTQVAIGELLGVSGPTVNRWEKDPDQLIPETAQKLLRLLIYGQMPFGTDPGSPEHEAEHLWKLRLTLEQWHQLEAISAAEGFSCVRDLLLDLTQKYLAESHTTKPLFIENESGDSVKNESCADPNLTAVPPATFTETAPSPPSPPDKGANIVQLPTEHWAPPPEQLYDGSGAGGLLAAEEKTAEPVESPRREVTYRKGKRG